MKYILLLLIVLNFSHAKYCKHTSKILRCVEFVKNYDGDTITVNIPNTHAIIGEEMPIRVLGLDTPEIRGKTTCEKEAAIIARDYVRYRIAKSNTGDIELRNISRGKYFRIVAEIWVNGRNLTNALLNMGLAYSYNGGTKEKVDWCKRLDVDLPDDMDKVLEEFNKKILSKKKKK
jgi:micrococcal nuclease